MENGFVNTVNTCKHRKLGLCLHDLREWVKVSAICKHCKHKNCLKV